MDIFAVRLKKQREKRKLSDPKWTQVFVAEKIGVARPTYTAYENGTKQPPIETINKIADLLDVTTDYLLGRTDDPNGLNKQQDEIEDTELDLWFKELKEASPERREELKRFWDFIKEQEKGRKPGDKQGE